MLTFEDAEATPETEAVGVGHPLTFGDLSER